VWQQSNVHRLRVIDRCGRGAEDRASYNETYGSTLFCVEKGMSGGDCLTRGLVYIGFEGERAMKRDEL
jgi:hypothetical protein